MTDIPAMMPPLTDTNPVNQLRTLNDIQQIDTARNQRNIDVRVPATGAGPAVLSEASEGEPVGPASSSSSTTPALCYWMARNV